MLVPEFFSEILLEAQAVSELATPVKEIERKSNKIYEINMQLESLSERLGLLPKAVNPKHVFDQMEKLSLQKLSLETEIKGEEIEIYFYVGERYYKRELDLSGSRLFSEQALEKKQTSPLPIFHGNLETSKLLHFKSTSEPKNINDAGSNSLIFGRGCEAPESSMITRSSLYKFYRKLQ